MSADNGYIIRKNIYGKFALQEYSASAESYPPVAWDNTKHLIFDTLEDAIRYHVENLDSEYGLTIDPSIFIKQKKEKTTMEINTYVRKSFSVEAVQVTEDNFDEVAEWVGGDIIEDSLKDPLDRSARYIKVRVHHPLSQKQTQAYVGDWVLSSATGFKVYTNKAFKDHFDLDQSKLQQISAAADDLILKLKG